MIDNMKNILSLILFEWLKKKKKKMGKICESRLPLVLSSSFSNEENVVEEFTNIMHPEIILKK